MRINNRLYADLLRGKRKAIDRYRVKYGVIPYHPDYLYAACCGGVYDVAAELIGFLENINLPFSYSNETLLQVAASYGHGDIVMLLLAQGAEVEPVKIAGHSPLFDAIGLNSFEMVCALVTAGADMNRLCELSGEYLTPFERAERESPQIAAWLDSRNPLNRTQRVAKKRDEIDRRMFESCRACGYGMIDWFMLRGCDINARDSDGKTLLHHAVVREDMPACRLHIRTLLNYGADITITDCDGKAALEYASERVQRWVLDPLPLFPDLLRCALLLRWTSTDDECREGIEILMNMPRLRAAVDNHELLRIRRLNTTDAQAIVYLISEAREFVSRTASCFRCCRYTLEKRDHLSGSLVSSAAANEVEWGCVCLSCGAEQSIVI